MRASVRVLILVAAWCVPAATALPPAGVLRLCVVTVSLCLFPGLPLALHLRNRSAPSPDRSRGAALLETAVVTGAVSLSCTILASQLLVLAGTFSARLVFVVIAAITTVAVLVPTRRGGAAKGATAAG
ncbi:hypothetical protein [Streptomyces sp. NPDC085932]|uniref:hypothetical protein n=1 Tax=Streptomyces sp. NPDC085932 TaxID=3365741 RepID=UPI0037D8834B